MRRSEQLGYIRKLFESRGFKCTYFYNSLSTKNMIANPDGCNSIVMASRKYMVLVETEKCKYNPSDWNVVISLCPAKAFDRWSNSRSIQKSFFTEIIDKKDFPDYFTKSLTKMKWLADNIPIEYFDECIHIEL